MLFQVTTFVVICWAALRGCTHDVVQPLHYMKNSEAQRDKNALGRCSGRNKPHGTRVCWTDLSTLAKTADWVQLVQRVVVLTVP